MTGRGFFSQHLLLPAYIFAPETFSWREGGLSPRFSRFPTVVIEGGYGIRARRRFVFSLVYVF
jgi:hypothetical protein